MPNYSSKWGSWKEAPPAVPEQEIKETVGCDVAVAGAGIAGVTCALRAAQNGLNVVVLEKTEHWNARGGNIGVANSKFMRSQGYENDLDVLAREWIKRCASRCDETVLWRYLKNSEAAMDWLLDIVTGPEYGARPELQACLYKGDTYLERFGSHRLFDGPMAKKGMRPGASDAVYAMYSESLKLGVKYYFSAPAQQLEKEDGRVVSVLARTADGYIRVKASKGVVLATGDIGGSQEMMEDLAPLAAGCAKKIYTPKGANTGDGHRMGLWAGGAFEDAPFPVMMHPQGYGSSNYCFLFVDLEGKRFMNEDNNLQGKCVTLRRLGMDYAWSILDGDWDRKIPESLKYGGGIFWGADHAPDEPDYTTEGTVRRFERSRQMGSLVEADTPEGLAEKMGVPADQFVKTLEEYNKMCREGRDTRFGKRKELLMPLDKPPYMGIKFGPAVLAVVGGLRVGADMEVLDGSGRAVPGLYAVGNAAGGRYGVDYPMVIPGTSHGTALTLAWVLGNVLAE
ncbi:MAG: FAD-dependent oxidoreductase [Firmicutes bacterium]|nr:FAD-dependent oxidoreductase [Bacillota bacterium]